MGLTAPGPGILLSSAGNPLANDFSASFFFVAGDADHNRTVNALDFNAMAGNFGASPRSFSQGDFNYDTIVNALDFNILAKAFGFNAIPSLPLSSSLVPEPALTAVNVLAPLAVLRRRRQRS